MKAVIFVAEGTQDEEFLYPYYRLKEEGFDVVVIATGRLSTYKEKTVVYGKYKIPLPVNDKSNSLVKHYDASLLIIPGGWQGPELMRMDKNMLEYTQYMMKNNKVVASICHGPWVLASAGVLAEKAVTGYVGIKDDITNAGGIYVDAPVVIDQNLITAPHYDNNPEFMRAVLENVRRHSS